jgi:hypothetical protein
MLATVDKIIEKLCNCFRLSGRQMMFKSEMFYVASQVQGLPLAIARQSATLQNEDNV